MIGTIVNTGAIIIGSAAGSLLKKGISEKYSGALFSAIGGQRGKHQRVCTAITSGGGSGQLFFRTSGFMESLRMADS